jgi:hypothetical protein
MCELATDPKTFETWKGKFPAITNAAGVHVNHPTG